MENPTHSNSSHNETTQLHQKGGGGEEEDVNGRIEH